MTYRARCLGKKRRMQAKARPEWWQHVGFMTTPAGGFTWVTASDGEGGSAPVPMRDGEHMIGFAKGEP